MTGILWAAPITQIEVLPKFSNRQGQHLTLAYGVERSEYEEIIGLPATIAVIANAYNNEVQALRAILPNWLPCQNISPHMTVSWVDGSVPVRSNLMLEGEHHEEEFKEIVHCVIEFIEWRSKEDLKTWKERPLQQCKHIWKTGEKVGQQCSELTRRSSGYCTKHRPNNLKAK